MKNTIVRIWLVLFCFALVFNQCSREETRISSGQLTFSMNSTKRSSNGRVADNKTVTTVLFTLKKTDGTTISDRIGVVNINGAFVTQPLNFPTGHYELIQFLLLNASDTAIYAAPLAGSNLADLVTNPLPIPFDISPDTTTNLSVSVVDVGDNMASDFGYAQFNINIVHQHSLNISITIAAPCLSDTIHYLLEVLAKDKALGTVLWKNSFSIRGSTQIHIPDDYGHYTFKVSKAGYIYHQVHLLVSEMIARDSLAFEFLPEDLSGFRAKILANGNLKLYLPNDENRCKLYARVDVAEGYQLTYFYIDKSASSYDGTPVGELVFYEYLSDSTNFSAVGRGTRTVNLFDNLPFNSATNYCSVIDLKAANDVKSPDDALLESFLYVQTAVSDVFFEDYNRWDAPNHKGH